MEEPSEQPAPTIVDQGTKEDISATSNDLVEPVAASTNYMARYKWWLRISICTTLVLAGQAVANLLARLYFNRGGNSKWLAALLQSAGFPLLIPFLFFFSTSTKVESTTHNRRKKPPSLILVSFYVFTGILSAGCSMLYTVGIAYLPVSTFSLIVATTLAFNAFFSYFINAQKLTPYIINSLLLLTLSSVLLVFQNDQPNNSTNSASERKYGIGFVCTVVASAIYGFILAATQFAFTRIVKTPTFRAVVNMNIFPSIVSTAVLFVVFFVSGEWKNLSRERMGYKTGTVSYVLNCAFIAVAWQLYNVGLYGLIFEVSSVFSNSISAVGLPIVPVCAVIFFQDKMNGVKVISMLLAIWGFISYIYQHYLDDQKNKAETINDSANQVSLAECG